MPYASLEAVPANLKKLNDVALSLSQANWIAHLADKLEGEGQVESPWGVAISQFKKTHVVKGERWVSRKKSRSKMRIRDFDDKNIQGVTDASLGALHGHAHEMAEAGKGNAAQVMRLHDLCRCELARRDKEEWHQTILQFRYPRGLYMAPPHGELIYQGKKGSIARSQEADLAGKWAILSGGKAYGEAVIGNGEEIPASDFDARFEEHRVTTKERERWWPRERSLWLYPINFFVPYAEPLEVDVLSGMKMIMEKVPLQASTKVRHAKNRCMFCTEPPEVDFLWSNGRGRAWFCTGHARAWLEKGFDGQDVTRAWQIEGGQVPEKVGDGEKPLWSKGTAARGELLARIGEKGGKGSGWFGPEKGGTHGPGSQGGTGAERERAEGISAQTYSRGGGQVEEKGHNSGWRRDRRVVAHMAFYHYNTGTGDLLIVQDKGETVGIVGASSTALTEVSVGNNVTRGKYREIYAFATKRRGYGRATMDEVLRQAEGRGEGVYLKAVLKARGFYQKIGMRTTESIYGKEVFYWTPKEVADAVKESLADLEPEDGVFVDSKGRLKKTAVRVTGQRDSKARRLAYAEKVGADLVEERELGSVVIEAAGREFPGTVTVGEYKTRSTGNVWYRYDVDFQPPIAIEGKGENSWDQGTDHIYSISVPLESDDEAGYKAAQERIAKGMPVDRLIGEKGSARSGHWGHSGGQGPGPGGSTAGGGLARIGASPSDTARMRRGYARVYRRHREIAPELPDSARAEVIKGIREVWNHGLTTGNEALVVLDLQGKRIDGVQRGGEHSVSMGDFVKENGEILPIVVHNHPSGASFSQGDVAWLFSRDVEHLVVAGHNGTLYRMSRTEKTPSNKWLADLSDLAEWEVQDRPADMTVTEARAAMTAMQSWGNIFNKDYVSWTMRTLDGSVTPEEANYEHTHRVNQEFAYVLNLDYERIEPHG